MEGVAGTTANTLHMDAEPTRVAADHPPLLNWALVGCVLTCVLFWAAVITGLVVLL